MLFQHCSRIILSTIDYAAAYKFNVAYFESSGLDGYSILKQLLLLVPNEIPVILDGKRGDIAESSKVRLRVTSSARF